MPVKGWAFFTLSKECAEYAYDFVKQHPRYVRFFKHTMFSDEYFWHTILLKSLSDTSHSKQTPSLAMVRYSARRTSSN
jgi:hypothetical protein